MAAGLFTGIEPRVLCLAALCSKAVAQWASTYEFILALTKIVVAPGYRAKDFSSPACHVWFWYMCFLCTVLLVA